LHQQLILLAVLGTCFLLMAWLPSLSKITKISYPIFLLVLGMCTFWLGIPFDWPAPFWKDDKIMLLSEIIVNVSLMSAGLKINLHYAKKNWRIPLRLIAITMPLTILAFFLLGISYFSLSIPLAILFAAVLAPTDPVLASEVQLKDTFVDKDKGEKNLTEFSLTSEAGLNDGLAFPITYLAVLLIENNGIEGFDWLSYLGDKVFLKVGIGIASGLLFGYLVARIQHYLKKGLNVKTRDGLLAFSIAICCYSVTELIHGYGFLAVFIASLTVRNSYHINDDYKKKLHSFVEETERLLLVLWLVLFGGSILNGVFDDISWMTIAVAVGCILILRPVCGMIGLVNTKIKTKERLVLSFFGIRGIGSLFYLSWAFMYLKEKGIEVLEKDKLYSIVILIVFCSILIHGFTAPYLFKNFKKK